MSDIKPHEGNTNPDKAAPEQLEGEILRAMALVKACLCSRGRIDPGCPTHGDSLRPADKEGEDACSD